MPSVVTGNVTAIHSIFFAPGGTVGYAVGVVDTASPLLLKTTDSGATWFEPTGIDELIEAADDAPNFPSGFLYTGFALDANNVWVGGDNGTVFYSATGAM